MQLRRKRALRTGPGQAGTRREAHPHGPAEPPPAGCGWFDSSDELRRGLDVLEAEEGAAPPIPLELLRPPLLR